MNLLDSIRERIATAIQPQRNRNPNQRGRADRNIGAVQNGNALEASIRGTVFACLQIRANALANMSFDVYRETNYDKDELPNSHWLKDLLKNPNPYFTRSQVFTYIENWLSINGNAFIWTPTNGYRVPLQMWVLNPTRMRIIKGSDNFIEGYVYQSAQEGNIAIPEKEVIHLARIHPASRPEEIVGMNLFGVGLVEAALEYANIDREVSSYLARLFKNNAIPPLIAKYPERFDYDEWERLKSRWNEELPDYKLRALLASGLQLELPPKGELSISYDSVSSDTRSQIAQVFGVPPGMLTGEYQNRATAEVQWAIFRQNTMDPEGHYIAEEFSRHFRRWDENLLVECERFAFDDPLVELQKEEFELKWGIKTINEARRERGYDTTPVGDAPMIAGGFIPLDSIVVVPSEETDATLNVQSRDSRRLASQDKGLNNRNTDSSYLQTSKDMEITSIEAQGDAKIENASLESRDYFWRKYDLLTEENSLNIAKIVEESIQELKTEVKNRLDSGVMNLDDLNVEDADYWKFEQAVQKSCETIKRSLAKELGLNVKKLPPSIDEYIDEITEESGQKIRSSVGKIKEEIISELRKYGGEEPAVIEDALMAKFETLQTSRARAIAQTTSANATSGVQYTMYRENGFKMMWLTQRDGRVRPSHQQVDGKYPNASGMFTVGGEQTNRPLGNGLSANNVVNCRCQLFPVKS